MNRNFRYLSALFAVFLFAGAAAQAPVSYAASNFSLLSNINPEINVNADGDKYSGCWGWYQAAKGKEYAIACSQSGTYWVNVTNPFSPAVCAYRAGKFTGATWREAKTYQNYCYVISDDPGANSFQIFDMQYLPDSVHKVYDNDTLFSRGHTLWVDGNKLYVASVTYSNGSYHNMAIYSLANPVAPVLLRRLDQDYAFIPQVHDMYVRHDTVFASCAYSGLNVFKYNSSANTFSMIGSLTSYTASGYNHSSALTPDGKTLVFTDEVPAGLPIKIANVSNLANIQVLATVNQFSMTTPHNPFVVSNKYCFVSSYEDGIQLFDISVPASPQLAGFFDTFPQGGGNIGNWGGNYGGQWGCYPFFPSKNIFALDMLNGLFMLRTPLYPSNITGLEGQAEPIHGAVFAYPNPASDRIFLQLSEIKSEGIACLEILSADGKKIIQHDLHLPTIAENNVVEIKTTGLPSGLYFFKLISGSEPFKVQKIIIKH